MSGSEELDYKDEEQDWYMPKSKFPTTDILTREQYKQLQQVIDVVIMTATEVELYAVVKYLNPYPEKEKVLQVSHNNGETYYLGKFGEFITVVTQCQMGSVGQGSATLATERALNTWNPRAIIMVGIAFGKDPSKQKIADVLVASAIIPYEKQRVGKEIVFRSFITPSNTYLLNHFQNTHGWQFNRPDNRTVEKIVGSILSGEKLVDNLEFKTSLFKDFRDAVGGEMEGAGLCAAARDRAAWILVKSICDWGDGTKSKKYQSLAAAAATSLVHHVLSNKTALNGIGKIVGFSFSYNQTENSDNDELLEILNSELKETQEKIIEQSHNYLITNKRWVGDKANDLQEMLTNLMTAANKKTLEEFLKSLITNGELPTSLKDKIAKKYNLGQPSIQHKAQPYLLVKFTPTSDKKNFLLSMHG